MKYFPIILSLISLLPVSCVSQPQTNFDKKAIALNSNAVDLMGINPDSALLLLDKAIAIEKKYYVAYNNKVTIYCSMGEYENAIVACKKGLEAKPDLAEAIVFLGMLYDKIGQPDKANLEYQKAIIVFNKRLLTDKNKEANKINRAFAKLLSGNDIEGNREANKLLEEYPNNTSIKSLKSFRKDDYLNEIFKNK